MVTLKHPFDAESLHYLAMKILKGLYPPPHEQYSAEIKSLIKGMLSKRIEDRPSLAEIIALPFLVRLVCYRERNV